MGSWELLAIALLFVFTVAVTITFAPVGAVPTFAQAEAVVAAWETVTVIVELLAEKLLSPAYAALIVCVPAGSWIG